MMAPGQYGKAREPGDGERALHGVLDGLIAAALEAVDPRHLVETALAPRATRSESDGRLLVVAVGKAALAMAGGAWRQLERRIDTGIVLVPRGAPGTEPPGFRRHDCGHPLPDRASVEGATDVLTTVRSADRGDTVLLLLSGGASACLTLPVAGVSLKAMREVTRLLLRSGAAIEEMNAVRKHLDRVKGGQLARAADPARLSALVLSDVPGDRLDVIGSGPASADPSTYAAAIEVLERRGIWREIPPSVRAHLARGREGEVPETPKEGDPCFDSAEVHVIGSASVAVEAARREAERRGYRATVLATDLTGEAREVGSMLGTRARAAGRTRRAGEPPVCILAGGETTVRVVGAGRGGRNQEVALAAAVALDGTRDVLVASIGTDGVDGPTDAAGARATGSTLTRAATLGLDPTDHLARNDSYAFFAPLGDLIVTGSTGTNVMDLMIALIGTTKSE